MKIFNLIIMDESGSMASMYREALSGLNETLQSIKSTQEGDAETQQLVTLLTFNSDHQTFLLANAPAEGVTTLTENMYNPNACTPLYDAIGKGIANTRAAVQQGDHVLVTIITDGYENSSREYSLGHIQKLISDLKEQNWTFTFIGTSDLDVQGMSKMLHIDEYMCFDADSESMHKMWDRDKKSRSRFVKELKEGKARMKGSFFDEE